MISRIAKILYAMFLLSCDDEPSTMNSNQPLSGDDQAWNAIIDYWIQHDLDELPEHHRPLAAAFWFDADVQNGGLAQYFHNKGFDQLPEVRRAIMLFNASEHEALLTEAISRLEARHGSVGQLSHEQAQEIDDVDFNDLDTRYFRVDAITYMVEEEFKKNRSRYQTN